MGWLGRLFRGSDSASRGRASRGVGSPVHDAVSDSELGTWDRAGLWGEEEPEPKGRRSFGGATAYLLIDQHGMGGQGPMGG